MAQHGIDYRTIRGAKHHQCTGCREWKLSNPDNFQRSGQAGLSFRGLCRVCVKAGRVPAECNDARAGALALANRAIAAARERAALLTRYQRPSVPVVTDSYAPSIFDISTAPSLGFLFADFDETRGLRFTPVEPD